MRGRTNADAGLQLNATIDTYEVANGETIVSGDFVQRILSVSGETTIDANNNYPLRASAKTIARFSNNKYLERAYTAVTSFPFSSVIVMLSHLFDDVPT